MLARIAGLWVALVIVATASAGEAPAALAAADVVATFRVGDAETYRIRLTDSDDIAVARDLLAGRDGPTIPNGLIVRGEPDVNIGYSWHIDSGSLEFADVATEVCDGLPSDVEATAWTSDRYCPWSARLIALDEIGAGAPPERPHTLFLNVVVDANRNGQLDQTDPPLSETVVTAAPVDDSIETTTITDAIGRGNLILKAGRYRFKVADPLEGVRPCRNWSVSFASGLNDVTVRGDAVEATLPDIVTIVPPELTLGVVDEGTGAPCGGRASDPRVPLLPRTGLGSPDRPPAFAFVIAVAMIMVGVLTIVGAAAYRSVELWSDADADRESPLARIRHRRESRRKEAARKEVMRVAPP